MTAAAALRAEVEGAALGALARDGVGFSRAAVWGAFVGRGASRATVYRWIALRLAGGAADAAGGTAERIGTMLVDVRRRASALPGVLGRDALALRFVEIIGTAVSLVADARGPGGRFVKPRLALDALDLLRRTLMNAAELAALDSEAGDVLFREPILRELGALLDAPAR